MLRAARPHARFYGIQKSSSFRCLDPLDQNYSNSVFGSQRVLVILSNLRKYENRARVHFIPNLKVGVFVTLRTPDVIKVKAATRSLYFMKMLNVSGCQLRRKLAGLILYETIDGKPRAGILTANPSSDQCV